MMPFLETPYDLVEVLADLIGVYGGHDDGEARECRVCFVSAMVPRIRQAVENERVIANANTITAMHHDRRATEEQTDAE